MGGARGREALASPRRARRARLWGAWLALSRCAGCLPRAQRLSSLPRRALLPHAHAWLPGGRRLALASPRSAHLSPDWTPPRRRPPATAPFLACTPPIAAVEEAVPLLHSGLELAPMLEAALAQAEAHYAAKGMKVVGYYHANERHADNELGGAARAGA